MSGLWGHWRTFAFLLWSHSSIDLAVRLSPVGEIYWPCSWAPGSQKHALLEICLRLDSCIVLLDLWPSLAILPGQVWSCTIMLRGMDGLRGLISSAQFRHTQHSALQHKPFDSYFIRSQDFFPLLFSFCVLTNSRLLPRVVFQVSLIFLKVCATVLVSLLGRNSSLKEEHSRLAGSSSGCLPSFLGRLLDLVNKRKDTLNSSENDLMILFFPLMCLWFELLLTQKTLFGILFCSPDLSFFIPFTVQSLDIIFLIYPFV